MTTPDPTPSAPEHNYEYGLEHDGYSHMGIPPACPACAAESKASEPAPDTDPSATLAGIAQDPAVILEYIRDGAEAQITHPDDECGVKAGGSCTPHGALLAVAGLEAVLALADDWKTGAAATAERVAGHTARGDGHAAAFASGSAETLTDCARTLREAISREITEKGESDG